MAFLVPESNKLYFPVWQSHVKNTIIGLRRRPWQLMQLDIATLLVPGMFAIGAI
jgi:hypothetical protein